MDLRDSSTSPGPSVVSAPGYAPRVECSDFFVSTELEIVEYEPPYRLVSRSANPIRSLTSWTLTRNDDQTTVTFTGDYQLPLGLRILGDRAVEQVVGAQVRASLVNLSRAFPG